MITGFTAGIAVSIFSSQVKDLLGLPMDQVPADFLPKLAAYGGALDTVNPASAGLALRALALIVALRRWLPRGRAS